MCNADIFLGFLALLFPPLPVWVKRGICSADSIINILLCILGYIPGLIHAWYIIAKFPEPEYEYYEPLGQDGEGGRVTYVFVSGQPQRQSQPRAQQGNPNYGTAGAKNKGNSNNNKSKASGQPAPGPAPVQPQPQQGPSQNAGEGSSSNDGPAPPSYAAAVSGDHKVQSHD